MTALQPTILIVDDEPSVRRSLTVLLRKNYAILAVATGQEALAELQKANVDLVLLDLRLPDCSGLELLQKIKELDEKE